MAINIVEFPVNTLSKEEILESINEAMPKDINKFKGYAFVLYDDKNIYSSIDCDKKMSILGAIEFLKRGILYEDQEDNL